MDKSDKILEAISSLAANLGGRMDKLEAGQAELKAGQARLEGDVTELKAGQTMMRGDIEQTRREVSAAHFRVMGRIDQLSDQLHSHLADPLIDHKRTA